VTIVEVNAVSACSRVDSPGVYHGETNLCGVLANMATPFAIQKSAMRSIPGGICIWTHKSRPKKQKSGLISRLLAF
jgi:hypothetical protein